MQMECTRDTHQFPKRVRLGYGKELPLIHYALRDMRPGEHATVCGPHVYGWGEQGCAEIAGYTPEALDAHLEIRGLTPSVKTRDLRDLFGPVLGAPKYKLRWVDDSHALAIFSSPDVAHAVLERAEELASNGTAPSPLVACVRPFAAADTVTQRFLLSKAKPSVPPCTDVRADIEFVRVIRRAAFRKPATFEDRLDACATEEQAADIFFTERAYGQALVSYRTCLSFFNGIVRTAYRPSHLALHDRICLGLRAKAALCSLLLARLKSNQARRASFIEDALAHLDDEPFHAHPVVGHALRVLRPGAWPWRLRDRPDPYRSPPPIAPPLAEALVAAMHEARPGAPPCETPPSLEERIVEGCCGKLLWSPVDAEALTDRDNDNESNDSNDNDALPPPQRATRWVFDDETFDLVECVDE
eukprot:gnl/Trimastix_PCT/3147.p1 GENE.gnl/Trimastix_PCT/3147~~gnl/Trimastix_PCT/3147.p1  ORF type:complete len:415 (+),score=112.60 gnl/Trimastix_PCT/3147:212-1456(+)